MKIILLFLSILVSSMAFAQESKLKNENDSLIHELFSDLPVDIKESFLEELQGMTLKEQNEFLKKVKKDQIEQLIILDSILSSFPVSSKKELIRNLETHEQEIHAVKAYCLQSIPKGQSVYIEFNPIDSIQQEKESLDFWFSQQKSGKESKSISFQEWAVDFYSPKMDSLLHLSGLKREQLLEIKRLLQLANCISIRVSSQFELGFARSGMGKYSYLIFDKALTKEQQKENTNGCNLIFYRDNIVLTYGSGAIGSDCFPDEPD